MGYSDRAAAAEIIERQREIYGVPLGELIARVTTALNIPQARLARALGVSPAMLSQLSTGRRVKIGDPLVLNRLLTLDQRCARDTIDGDDVETVLRQVHADASPWTSPGQPAPPRQRAVAGPDPNPRNAPTAEDAFRGVSSYSLATAAREVANSFPEIAAVLRRAARNGPR